MKSRPKRILRAFSIAWLLLVLASGWIWLQADRTGPTWWDQSRHARNALALTDQFISIGPGSRFVEGLSFSGVESNLVDLLTYYDFYPPGSYYPTIPFHLIFGRDYSAACLSILLFWVPLLFASTVGAARYLLGRGPGWIAGAIVLSFPYVLAMSKDYSTDLQTATMTALILWTGLRSDLFLNPRLSRSAHVGLAVGLSLWVKWSMGLYVLGPLLLAFIRGIKRNPMRLFRNLAVSAAVAVPIAAIWYWPNKRVLRVDLASEFAWGADKGYPDPISLDSVVYYSRLILEEHLYLPGLVFLLAGVAILYRRRTRLLAWLGVSLLLPYLVLIFIRNKDPRFIMGLLPYCAIGLSAFVLVERGWLRRAWMGMYFLWALFLLRAGLFGISWLPPQMGPAALPLYKQNATGWSHPPRVINDASRQAEIDARAHWICSTPAPRRTAVVDVQVDRLWLTGYRLDYYGQRNGRMIRISARPDAPFFELEGWPSSGPLMADFVLAVEGEAPPDRALFRPVARYSTSVGKEHAILYAAESTPLVSPEFDRRILFTDPPKNQAICLQRHNVAPTVGQAGPSLQFDFWWTVASRSRNRFEYIRRIHAAGPSPFSVMWIGPSTWLGGESKFERSIVPVPPDVSPGRYRLSLKMEERPARHDLKPIPIRIAGIGVPLDSTEVDLGTVDIPPPSAR